MPIRLKITLLFTLLVIIIWATVCSGIYYFSSMARIEASQKRLSNRAITTSRFLQQSEIFDQNLIRRIDSSTTLALKRKSVQAYRIYGERVYYYNENPGDTITVGLTLLRETFEKGTVYYQEGIKDVVAYYDKENQNNLIVVCAAEDADGKARLGQLKKILTIFQDNF